MNRKQDFLKVVVIIAATSATSGDRELIIHAPRIPRITGFNFFMLCFPFLFVLVNGCGDAVLQNEAWMLATLSFLMPMDPFRRHMF